MLSYQHLYHAGCMADIHKHVALAALLDHITRKNKAITYMETHAARGLYNLNADESLKTGEAETGIKRFNPDDLQALCPAFCQTLKHIHQTYGPTYYPGSPAIAHHLLRDYDKLHLCELHPQEFAALTHNMTGKNTTFYQQDGYTTVLSMCPPTPRRGLVLIDPSFEVKNEYTLVADFIPKLLKRWPDAIILLWYPILAEKRHIPMVEDLKKNCAHIRHAVDEIVFQQNKGMEGSGLFILNPPIGYTLPDFNTAHDRLVHQP